MTREKNCTKCNKLKLLSEYNIDKRSSDGRTSSCRSCANKYSRNMRELHGDKIRAYYRAHRSDGSGLESLRKYAKSKKGKDVAKRSQEKWKEKNKHKRLAHSKVAHGIDTGKIEKKPCERCGSMEKLHAHHEDYTKPFEIIWLCCTHHNERHREILDSQK